MFGNAFSGYVYAIPYVLLVLALIVIAALVIVLLLALIRRVRIGTRLAEFQLEMALIDASGEPQPEPRQWMAPAAPPAP